jgi:chemotaxis response regulator CheB
MPLIDEYGYKIGLVAICEHSELKERTLVRIISEEDDNFVVQKAVKPDKTYTFAKEDIWVYP